MNKVRYFLGAAILLISLSCCSNQKKQVDSGTLYISDQTFETSRLSDEADIIPMSVTFQDALGYSVTVDQPGQVAALSGSYAETWLLAGGSLAALTEDAYSERGILPEDGVANLGSLKAPDVELMIRLGIDFVILNAKITEHVALRDTLESVGMTTAYFEVETFADYLSMLKICTDITGEAELYERHGLDIQAQIEDAVAKSQRYLEEGHEAPKVLFIRAHSTNAKAKNSDSMTGAMLKDLGCVNIADSETGLLEDLSMEAIILEDPNFIFVTTQGASTEAAERVLAEGIQSHPAWSGLSAVKNGRYIFLPKSLFHYKPNDRWGESYEILAEILYGEE